MIDRREELRNIAIIAHVDHGKTTLVDAMLQQTGEFHVKPEDAQEAVLDSNPLERERGITILAKCTAVPFRNHKINIVDTPGHADFGSEVERILQMVDGVLLLVDAVDGPMPQTKFVTRKALQFGLSPIVVINKMDRPNASPQKVLNEVFDLFIDLGATDPQMDFPVIYASGRNGWAGREAAGSYQDLAALFETIIEHVPPPRALFDQPLQMQVTMIDRSTFVGKIGIGRIVAGMVKKGSPAVIVKPDGRHIACTINRLEQFVGLSRREVQEARAGEIVAVAGLEEVEVGDTLAAHDAPQGLPPLVVDEPTLSMDFLVNDSPFSGREGKFVTSRHLRERLLREGQTNVGLRVEELPNEGRFRVSGRGELHLSVLVETMRREGFELSLSRPQIIFKREGDQVLEPIENLVLDIPSECQGSAFSSLGRRGAKMINMTTEGSGRLRLEYAIPSRLLLGFKSEFLTLTRGEGLMHHSFHGYAPKEGEVNRRANGVLVAMEQGTSTGYAIYNLQDRATFFIGGGIEVYEGMIVGMNSRDNDLVVNPCKEKKMSNMRTTATDEALVLTPHRVFSLEQAIEFIAEDELIEVTPKSIRMRKKVLDYNRRKRTEDS